MTTTQPLGRSEKESAGGGCDPYNAIKGNKTWTLSFIISNNNTYQQSVHAPFKSQKQQNFETIFLNVEK